MSSLPCFFPQAFGAYLFPSERLGIILTALEALRDSSIHEKQGACSVLDAALDDPDYWLIDVSGLWLLPCPGALSGVVPPCLSPSLRPSQDCGNGCSLVATPFPPVSPQVPIIMQCIRRNLDSIRTASARKCLDSLLLQLTSEMSKEEVQHLLKFSPPSDRSWPYHP